jgi:hypothetical protein
MEKNKQYESIRADLSLAQQSDLQNEHKLLRRAALKILYLLDGEKDAD